MSRRTIGILGGMGPLATADLYSKIIQVTPATTDQQHLPVIIYADPSVPDRTAALLYGGEDPTPALIFGAQKLVSAGADFIVIPCNTAHAFIDRIRPACSIPVVNMIEESAAEVRRLVDVGQKAGILGTSGTIAAGLYQSALERQGLGDLIPDEAHQALVMQTIGHVKAGMIDDSAVGPVAQAAHQLEQAGASALLAACTELPVVLKQSHVHVPLIDPTDVLARAAVRFATRADAWNELVFSTGKVQSHVI
jgi:aspartate racemase